LFTLLCGNEREAEAGDMPALSGTGDSLIITVRMILLEARLRDPSEALLTAMESAAR
jgi:hypothetical protein